jgi:hypothetical protein
LSSNNLWFLTRYLDPDPHSFSKLDPNPHSPKKPDPDPDRHKVNAEPKHWSMNIGTDTKLREIGSEDNFM